MAKKRGKIKHSFSVGMQILLGLVILVYSVASFFANLRGVVLDYLFLFHPVIALVFLVLLGVLLMRQAITMKGDQRFMNFLVGFFLFLFGAFPILLDLGLSRILPVVIDLDYSYFLIIILLFFGSIYYLMDRYLAVFRNEYS